MNIPAMPIVTVVSWMAMINVAIMLIICIFFSENVDIQADITHV